MPEFTPLPYRTPRETALAAATTRDATTLGQTLAQRHGTRGSAEAPDGERLLASTGLRPDLTDDDVTHLLHTSGGRALAALLSNPVTREHPAVTDAVAPYDWALLASLDLDHFAPLLVEIVGRPTHDGRPERTIVRSVQALLGEARIADILAATIATGDLDAISSAITNPLLPAHLARMLLTAPGPEGQADTITAQFASRPDLTEEAQHLVLDRIYGITPAVPTRTRRTQTWKTTAYMHTLTFARVPGRPLVVLQRAYDAAAALGSWSQAAQTAILGDTAGDEIRLHAARNGELMALCHHRMRCAIPDDVVALVIDAINHGRATPNLTNATLSAMPSASAHWPVMIDALITNSNQGPKHEVTELLRTVHLTRLHTTVIEDSPLEGLLRALAAHPHPIARAAVVPHLSLPADLARAAQDPAAPVRRAVAKHEAITPEILGDLLEDPDASVIDAAAEHFAAMFAPS